MANSSEVDVKCTDFLRDNPHLYARKAKRKKIALISVEAANRTTAEVQLDVAAAELVAGNRHHRIEPRDVVMRKFSEFTWDFVLYSVLDFQPVTAAADVALFATGPIYNRRLRKQLHELTDVDVILNPGELKRVIIAFRGVSKRPLQLQISYRHGNEAGRRIVCDIE